MTVELPNITLKLNTEKKLLNTNTNTNESKSETTNLINNNIILADTANSIADVPIVGELAKSAALSVPSRQLNKAPSYSNLHSVKSPALVDNILRFKDQFTAYLIEYFKSDFILLNNILEVSDKIVFKMDDLKTLISILLEIEPSVITIDYEDFLKDVGCCGKICKKIPLFKKINDIIINNKQSFLISYNTIAIQLQTEFNISLSYVII
jgi:hypothetical protein